MFLLLNGDLRKQIPNILVKHRPESIQTTITFGEKLPRILIHQKLRYLSTHSKQRNARNSRLVSKNPWNPSLFHEYRTVFKEGVDSQNGTMGIFHLNTLNTGFGQILESNDP